MDEARRSSLKAVVALRPRLTDIRTQAQLACALSPLTWIAVMGVSLSDYLAQLDQLIALSVEAERQLAVEEEAADEPV